MPHLPPGLTSSFFPAVEDKKFGYGRPRLYAATAVGLFRYYKEATDQGALRDNESELLARLSVFLKVIWVCLSLSLSIMKPSGCFVGLPVSRREPPCRCGGRRGGLNDSQHCAVGPGLQSPQRWSFPPASISLAVSLHSTRSSSPLSIQPFRYAETSTFFRPSPRCFSNLPMALCLGRPCQISSRSFAPRIFYQVAKSFMKAKVVPMAM